MRLLAFATHPIQYQVPIWRALAHESNLDFEVLYFSDHGLSEAIDSDFGRAISWDLPLLDGYRSRFVSKRPLTERNSFRLTDPKRFLCAAKPDVVLIHGYTLPFARQVLRQRRSCKYGVVLSGEPTEMRARRFDPKRLPRAIYLNWFYSQVDHFCPIGVDAIHHLRRFGVPPSRMSLSPYSVDDTLIEAEKSKHSREGARSKLEIPQNAVVVLFSGKLIPRKQPLLLAKALCDLHQDFPELFPIFLGSGELEWELNALLSARLGHRYLCPGFVNQTELAPYFCASDLFVLPSTYDTWGLVVNEAMHFGLPCIVSDMVGAGRDLIVEGVTGYCFDHRSNQDLRRVLLAALTNSDKLRLMGKAAEERISRYRIADTVEGLIRAMRSDL